MKQLEVDLFRPPSHVRLVTTHTLPLAVWMDGSSHKACGSGDAELVAVYSPVSQKPLILDWKSLGKSTDATRTLIRVAGDSVTGKSWRLDYIPTLVLMAFWISMALLWLLKLEVGLRLVLCGTRGPGLPSCRRGLRHLATCPMLNTRRSEWSKHTTDYPQLTLSDSRAAQYVVNVELNVGLAPN